MTSKELRIRELERGRKLADYRLDVAFQRANALTSQIDRIRMPTQTTEDAAGNCTAGSLKVHVTCFGTIHPGATVTVTGPGGFSATGVTNSTGDVTFSIIGFPPGVYHVVVSEVNFVDVGVDAVVTCNANVVNVPMGVATINRTIHGTIFGCNSAVLAGATVTIKNGATVLGTTTSDGSGAYSVTFATGGAVSFSINASKDRFNDGSTFRNLFCVGDSVVDVTLGPITGYRCDPCGGPIPISETLNWTPPFGDPCVLTYTGILGGWAGVSSYTTPQWSDCFGGPKPTVAVSVPWYFNCLDPQPAGFPQPGTDGCGPFQGGGPRTDCSMSYSYLRCIAAPTIFPVTPVGSGATKECVNPGPYTPSSHSNFPFVATYTSIPTFDTGGTGTGVLTE